MTDQLFLIGAHKAGTTTLAEALDRHPDVELSDPKEPNTYYFTQQVDREAYLGAHWSGRPVAWRLDASTTYSRVGLSPELPIRLRDDFPSARVLYIVRDPVDRITSAWMQDMEQEAEDVLARDFPTALREVLRLVESSRYARQLAAYRAAFGHDAVRLLDFGALQRDLAGLVRDVARWLDLDPAQLPEDLSIHANPSAGKVRTAPWYDAVRRSAPAVRRVVRRLRRHALVDRMVQGVADRATVPITRPVWRDEDLAWVVEELAPQVDPVAAELGLGPQDWPTYARAAERLRTDPPSAPT